jgi:nucleoside-diphosphate-sugar epimerase
MKVIEQGLHLGIYHIGTMDEITVSQLAQKVGAFFGKKVVVVPGKAQEGGTPRRCPDITKLRRLGYEPKVSFEEGLRMTARWYDENADKESNNPMKGR